MGGTGEMSQGPAEVRPPDSGPPAKEAEPAGDFLRAIETEFRLAAGRPERVEAACGKLLRWISFPPGPSELMILGRLAPLLRERGASLATPVFSLLEQAASSSKAPWTLLDDMVRARDRELAHRALALAARLAESGSLHVNRSVVQRLADLAAVEDSCLDGKDALDAAERIVSRLPAEGAGAEDPLLALYLRGGRKVRLLAARLLDRDGSLPPAGLARELLGEKTWSAVSAALDYTRATHRDLLSLAPVEGEPPPLLMDLSRAEGECGPGLVRQVIADLGWPRVNLGLEVRQLVGVSLDGSLPFMVSAWEAPLLERLPGARRVSETFLFTAHGGDRAGGDESASGGAVSRFRDYNLLHAQVLAELLDVAPLGAGKVRRILGRMDAIVEHFILLFRAHTDETGVLESVYGDLRGRILAEMERQASPLLCSAELTRLVQAFEDPRSLGEVRTLHGLKRYLHQRGLRLAFRLVETGRGTNRTVDLVAASAKVLRRGGEIRYIDFEPEEGRGRSRLPHGVEAVAEAFGRQLLSGKETFPGARIFCYGNEVHYYLTFANHPAFLRIDYAPPLQGGMIDLEYYGVSKNELSIHPNPSLDVVCRFLREMGFDALAENTRIHARYDKERALDLGDLREKAEALFRLVPYLMELDWIVGALELGAEARKKVAEAWAGSFARWGILPLQDLLTSDRRGILTALEADPSGWREISWSGAGSYRDRFAPVSRKSLAGLAGALQDLGLDPAPDLPEADGACVGQLFLERELLRPLREAALQGGIAATGGAPARRPADLFQREDEAALFAGILSGGDAALAASARLARRAAPLERSLRFLTTGSVGGHEVQRAALPLRTGTAALYVLRDGAGMIRLALFSDGGLLCRRRETTRDPWESSASDDAARFAALLRAGGYLAPGGEDPLEAPEEAPGRLRDLFRRAPRPLPLSPLPGERAVGGLKASPGRCVGRAVFPAPGRRGEDLFGSVLLAPMLRPEDNALLFRAAGVVSTGGGILSHAGLMALQFRKPALIIPGRWKEEADGSRTLLYRTLEYREESREAGGATVTLRRDVREREVELHEGDLVALDAAEGVLRAFGHERETLALHDNLRNLSALSRRLALCSDGGDRLALRGRFLRARFQTEKLLLRLDDPALARHVVRELLSGEGAEGNGGHPGRARLLALVLENPRVGAPAREALLHMLRDLERRRRSAEEEARDRLPASESSHEVLSARLEVLRLRRAEEEALRSAAAGGMDLPVPDGEAGAEVDRLAAIRLSELRDGVHTSLQVALAAPGPRYDLRHRLRQLRRIDEVLGNPECDLARRTRERIAREDEEAIRRLEGRRIMMHEDGGFELVPRIGWKAANLAEAERLGPKGAVPPWFVVTHTAFEELLAAPRMGREATAGGKRPAGSTLGEAIASILGRTDCDDVRKSALIRALWEAAELPEALSRELGEAYRRLGEAPGGSGAEDDPAGPFVAIRSSAREEDTEAAARAGEFDTFLFVRGEQAVRDHLKRAWSGLWSERAIHNRALLSPAAGTPGGGVIVQRIAWSRVSGVLQTVNAAGGEVREMVINAGLGMGEGIVSGAVAADHVVVSKDGDLERGPLRFRYITSDKQEQVVFNRRTGLGTLRVESLYHQRLRPALEYVELWELVRAAARLEAAYGYPLDLEFGIEGSRLWILQVRPVPAAFSVLGETLERFPLPCTRRPDARPSAEEIGR
jgi:pyruvate phosphate dikinase-like enzyme/PEP-utilizing family enzyme